MRGENSTQDHSEHCRKRMEELLKTEDNPRWMRAKEARGDDKDEDPRRRRSKAKRGENEQGGKERQERLRARVT